MVRGLGGKEELKGDRYRNSIHEMLSRFKSLRKRVFASIWNLIFHCLVNTSAGFIVFHTTSHQTPPHSNTIVFCVLNAMSSNLSNC